VLRGAIGIVTSAIVVAIDSAVLAYDEEPPAGRRASFMPFVAPTATRGSLAPPRQRTALNPATQPGRIDFQFGLTALHFVVASSVSSPCATSASVCAAWSAAIQPARF
jgi:hypothetical protein